MTRPEDHDLPPQLQHDLHSLVPEAPAQLSGREQAFLARVARSERPWLRWHVAVAAAAGLLITASAIHFQSSGSSPTIVDAFRAAKAGESQAKVDALAMAAVRIAPEGVSQ